MTLRIPAAGRWACLAAAAALVLTVAGPAPAAPTPATAPAGPTAPADRSAAVPPVPGQVVRPFVAPAHAYGPGHRGVDLAAEPGQPVRAALDGVVTFAGQVAGVGWVSLDHGGGLVTTYGDLIDVPARGTAVPTGAVVGRLAETATSLDWGARLAGAYLDPMTLLRRWRLHLTAASV